VKYNFKSKYNNCPSLTRSTKLHRPPSSRVASGDELLMRLATDENDVFAHRNVYVEVITKSSRWMFLSQITKNIKTNHENNLRKRLDMFPFKNYICSKTSLSSYFNFSHVMCFTEFFSSTFTTYNLQCKVLLTIYKSLSPTCSISTMYQWNTFKCLVRA
jgi:hypothetical protein